MKKPTKEEIRAKRNELGLTQTQAASVIYRTLRCWQEWECGNREMDAALWELFLIKTLDKRYE